MDLVVEDCAAKQRGEDFRQQEIRDGLELISGGRMAGDIHTEAAQLLNETPDFGTIGRNLLRDFCSADDDGGMLHQEAHDAAEANVGGLLRVFAGAGLRGQWARRPGWGSLPDAGIMLQMRGNNK